MNDSGRLQESGPVPREAQITSIPVLHSLCEALARWGDPGYCLSEVCRALAEIPAVRYCACYVREVGEWKLSRIASYPETPVEPGVEADLTAFITDVLATKKALTRRLADGSTFYGLSAPTRKGDDMAMVVHSTALSDRGEGEILNTLAFVVHLGSTALRSLESMEAGIEDRALRRLQMMRSEMVTTLSHEMRTPLAGIKGYVTALLRSDVTWDEQTRLEFLQVISDESDKLEKMVSSILDMAAMETGNVSLEKCPTVMPRLVSDAVSKIGVKSAKHTFVIDFEPGFPVAVVDPLRIEQVIYNLLDNAVKYSPDGGLIVVSGRVLPDRVVIAVADQGRGIPPEHLNRLFEKFFRIGSLERVNGVGLGLPIARQLVEGHGGRIWAESVEGKGTTVYFTLPVEAGGEEPK
ncbi:MAG: hypothetical protein HPY55_01060 [Firmicutes bacterium]|nr:hypothetical protein [Bacillota bacterium]